LDEAVVVVCLLEQRERVSRQRFKTVDVGDSRDPDSIARRNDAGEHFAASITCVASPVGCGLSDRHRAVSRAAPPLCHREIDFEVDIKPARAREHQSPLEQIRGRGEVTSPEGPPAGCGERFSTPFRQGSVFLAEFLLVARGLLKVIADNLVELHAEAADLEPTRETLVQLCTD
jgi:hypothetical protein